MGIFKHYSIEDIQNLESKKERWLNSPIDRVYSDSGGRSSGSSYSGGASLGWPQGFRRELEALTALGASSSEVEDLARKWERRLMVEGDTREQARRKINIQVEKFNKRHDKGFETLETDEWD